MPPASRVGLELPTPGQLAELQRLCALTGWRYSPPRSAQQARRRLRDLAILAQRAKGGTQPASAPPKRGTNRRQRRPGAARLAWSDFPGALSDLSRAHYTAAKAVERGDNPQPHLRRAAQLEVSIDRLMETPIGR